MVVSCQYAYTNKAQRARCYGAQHAALHCAVRARVLYISPASLGLAKLEHSHVIRV